MGYNLLNGKTVVITGSTRGIGRAIAQACAEAGASVVVSSRSADNVALTVANLRRAGLAVNGLTANIAEPEDLKDLFDFALTACGRIDAWVNNAGISGGYRTLQSMTSSEIKEIIDINLLGVFYACRMLIPHFREHRGIILNMGGRGAKGKASPYQAPYAATKAAVLSLTCSLAAENRGYPLSINCILPGMVVTDMYQNIITCPETENRMGIMPVLLRAFASPMPDVQKLVVKLCAQKPGENTGKCYSAEKWTRYLKALTSLPDFMRISSKTRRAERS